jgi:hypothetical protein
VYECACNRMRLFWIHLDQLIRLVYVSSDVFAAY